MSNQTKKIMLKYTWTLDSSVFFLSFSFDRSAGKTGEGYENRIREAEHTSCWAFSWPMLVSKSTAVEDCDLGFVVITRVASNQSITNPALRIELIGLLGSMDWLITTLGRSD
jgi:hypothetical protein